MAFNTTNAILATTFTLDAISNPAAFQNGSAPDLTFWGNNGTGNPFLANNGNEMDDDAAQWRNVSSPSNYDLLGKTVQLNDAGAFFRGTVIAVVGVELATTGATGPLSNCVHVLGQMGNRFLALATAVTALD